MVRHWIKYFPLLIIFTLFSCYLHISVKTSFNTDNLKYVYDYEILGINISIDKETYASLFQQNLHQSSVKQKRELLFCDSKKYSIFGTTYVEGESGGIVSDFILFCKLLQSSKYQKKQQVFNLAVQLLSEKDQIALQKLSDMLVD